MFFFSFLSYTDDFTDLPLCPPLQKEQSTLAQPLGHQGTRTSRTTSEHQDNTIAGIMESACNQEMSQIIVLP